MKKQHVASGLAAVLLTSTMAAPAFADLDAFAQIFKQENTTINVDIDIDKDIVVTAIKGTVVITDNGQIVEPDLVNGAAEASAFANVTNTGNRVNDENDGVPNPGGNPPDVLNLERTALINGSINGNSAIVGVNQDVGNMVNQANIVALAYTDVVGSVTDAKAGTDQLNSDNVVETFEVFPIITPPDADDAVGQFLANPETFQLKALIVDSINDNTGIVGVNQNTGDMNNQTNSVAVAAGLDPMVALGESDLGQENTFNRVDALNTVKASFISNSVTGNTGVVQVNQSSGHLNNQGSAITLSVGLNGATSASNFLGSVQQAGP